MYKAADIEGNDQPSPGSSSFLDPDLDKSRIQNQREPSGSQAGVEGFNTNADDADRDLENAGDSIEERHPPGLLSVHSHHLRRKVSMRHADLALLACCFVSGMLDASAFNNWSVFVGMQTGNTVILCLSTARLPSNVPFAYAATLVSLSSFFVGALTTAQLSRWGGAPSRRWVLAANFFAQALLIVVSAILVTVHGIVPLNNRAISSIHILDNIDIVIALPTLAFQSGAQIATSRLLGFSEIPINVLTSTYAGLATDPKLLARNNVKRNRQVAAVFNVFVGALCAAWIMKRGPGIMLCLWLGAGIKFLIGMGVLVLMSDESADQQHAE